MAEPPPVALCAEELSRVVAWMRGFLEGQYVLAVHTGTYCRDEFYAEPFLGSYRQAVAGGVRATTYKGGHFSFPAYMTGILEGAGLLAALSCAPGYQESACDAEWVGAPLGGGYLALENPALDEGQGTRSGVFEIPLGNSGEGPDDANTLYNEKVETDRLIAVYDAIADRARRLGRPQFVHYLFHNTSITEPFYLERFQRVIDHARGHGGVVATPSAAKAAFDALG